MTTNAKLLAVAVSFSIKLVRGKVASYANL